MNKIHNPRLAALNAALPHMNIKHQRQMALMIKIMEMRDICRYYDSLNVQAHARPQGRKYDLIAALIPHMASENQKTISTFLQVMEMKEIMSALEVNNE